MGKEACHVCELVASSEASAIADAFTASVTPAIRRRRCGEGCYDGLFLSCELNDETLRWESSTISCENGSSRAAVEVEPV